MALFAMACVEAGAALAVTTPANDDFDAAADVDHGSPNTSDWYYNTPDTTEATLEEGEPQPTGCVADGGSVGRTVWMKLVARADDGWRRLELSDGSAVGTFGHEFDDAVWTVWTGSSLSTLTQVACDDNSGSGRWPEVIFPATKGQTYYLQIGGVRAAGGLDAWGGAHPLVVSPAAGPPALMLEGPGNETGSPVEYVQPGVKQHWDIFTAGQTTTEATGGATVACTVDGFPRPCSTDAGLDVTPSAGEHTIVAKLVFDNEDVWATTTKRFTAGAPPTTTQEQQQAQPQPQTQQQALPDTTGPQAILALIKQKLRAALAKGLRVSVTSDEGGTAKIAVLVDRKTAKKLKLVKRVAVAMAKKKPVRVASAGGAVSAGKSTFKAKFTRKAKKALKRVRSVKLTVRTTVTDAAGNKTVASKVAKLRR